VPPSSLGHTDSHDEAVRAFDNADRGSDPTETSIALAIAQYHATMATYEIGLQVAAQLDVLTTLLASATMPTVTPSTDGGSWVCCTSR
jgi:hypothetical protein